MQKSPTESKNASNHSPIHHPQSSPPNPAETEAVQEQAAILLEGDAIRQIGTAETVQAPEGAPVQEFDYGDATILRGWWTRMST